MEIYSSFILERHFYETSQKRNTFPISKYFLVSFAVRIRIIFQTLKH